MSHYRTNFVFYAIILLCLVILPAYSLPRLYQNSTAACSLPSFLFAQPLHSSLRVFVNGPVTTGDFNGDSHLDVVTIASNNVAVMLGDGTGQLGAPNFFFVGPDPTSTDVTSYQLAVADVNNDNKLDVVTANTPTSGHVSNDISVLLGNGAGGFAPVKQLTSGTVVTALALADYNGDGKIDLATATNLDAFPIPHSGVQVRLGDGTGSFGPATQYQTPDNAINSDIKSADFNGDNKPDLVTTNPHEDRVSIFLNNGAGGFETARSFAAYDRVVSLLIGDFNGDGKADVVTTSSTSEIPNAISVLLGDGAGNLGAPINTTDFSVSSISAGDFNGDDKLDLVTTGGPETPLFVHLGDGSGHFGAPAAYDPSRFTSSIAATTGDFNRRRETRCGH